MGEKRDDKRSLDVHDLRIIIMDHQLFLSLTTMKMRLISGEEIFIGDPEQRFGLHSEHGI